MIVIVLQRVTPGLRGQLTRWMLEVHPGVFVGSLSARVRDKIWTLVSAGRGVGACTMVSSAANEQGFVMATAGDPRRAVVDYDGLVLLRRPDTRRGSRAASGP